MRSILKPLALAALASTVSFAATADETRTAWRLFVADQAAPTVRVIDAADGKTIETFTTKAPTALALSESGKTVFAVQGAANVAQVFSTGIDIDDHGDHGDLKVEAPKLLPIEFAGEKPAHFVDHHGQIALFYDGSGVVDLFSEKDVIDGKVTPRQVKADAAHHGVAVVVGGHTLVSEPNREKPDELPVGVRVFDKAGVAGADVHACPGLHGEAGSGELIAIACKTGLLVVKEGKDAPEINLLPYSENLPKDAKVSTLRGGKGLQYFLGNFGSKTVALIDPTAAEPYRLIDLPVRRVHFAVDPVRSKLAYVFTEDGKLHQIDVLDARITNSLQLTEPYSMDGHWNDPRPRIAVAGDEIIVTDPAKSRLVVLDAKEFRQTREIPVEGKPYNIIAVGGTGADHGQEAHAHDDEDQVYKGYFKDEQIAARELSDWAGDWQSVFPYLQDGTLDPVMAHKAESGDKSAAEYKAYYEIGYRTDVERIDIKGDTVSFYKQGKPATARYASDGHEILTYKKGNRGVRFIFKKVEGDADAPEFIQFSDHKIAPRAADHYHLYWGNDRAALLNEVTNWPTYYPASLSAKQIVDEMIAH